MTENSNRKSTGLLNQYHVMKSSMLANHINNVLLGCLFLEDGMLCGLTEIRKTYLIYLNLLQHAQGLNVTNYHMFRIRGTKESWENLTIVDLECNHRFLAIY